MRIVRDARLDGYTGQVVFESPILDNYGTCYGYFYSMKDHTGAKPVLIQKDCLGLYNVYDHQVVLDNNMIPNPSTGRKW